MELNRPATPRQRQVSPLVDGDGDVDCDDWDTFKLAWTAGGDPPPLNQCDNGIPTVSEWGLIAMLLLILAVGSVVFLRRRPVAG